MFNDLDTTTVPPPSMTADRLHEDVLGRIFELLTDDYASLKAASLVCRTWAMSTRRYVFEDIAIRPTNITTLQEILSQHPWPTVVPNIRRLQTFGAPGTTFRGCEYLSSISSYLTHFTFQDSNVETFELLIMTIHNLSQLQSLALIDVRFPPLSKKLQYAGRFLAPTTRRVRIRNTTSYPFLLWFAAHPIMPPLTHLDVGQLNDDELGVMDKVLFEVALSLQHIIISFGFGAVGHVCGEGQLFSDLVRRRAEKGYGRDITIAPTPNSARFQQVFGVQICGIFALMPNLTVVHIDSFVGQHEASSAAANAAEYFAARLLASVPGTGVKRIILGLGISSAAQLCGYNINWPYFDEILTSDAYKALKVVEFHHVGRGNLDNIANFITTKLPLTASKELLSFRKAGPGLTASDYA